MDYKKEKYLTHNGSSLGYLVSGKTRDLYSKIVQPLWFKDNQQHRCWTAPNSKIHETWEEIWITASNFLKDECSADRMHEQ